MRIRENIAGLELDLETAAGSFSPRAIDRGTRAMLGTVEFAPDDRVLDLGCGYGVVGIVAAHSIGAERVDLVDNDAEACRLARLNAERNGAAGVRVTESDGVEGLDRADFTLILCNPPYHEDWSVAKRFVHKGFNRLAIGGRMVFVTKRRTWYERKLAAIFGGVHVQEVDGYVVLTAEKRRSDYARTPGAPRRR